MYTHAPNDTHQDHRAVAIASLAAARRMQVVLYYETPSTQVFDPTVYVEISDVLERKMTALRAHRSQVDAERPGRGRSDRSRWRGSAASRVAYDHAEAFETPRFVWDLHTTPRRTTTTDRVAAFVDAEP